MSSEFATQLQAQLGAVAATGQIPTGVPCLELPVSRWADAAALAKAMQQRFVAEWATQDGADAFSIFMAFAQVAHGYTVLRTRLAGSLSFPSIVTHFVAASRMERVIQDFYGLRADGHPDPRTWIKHEHWPAAAHPLLKDFDAASSLSHEPGHYRFIAAEGEGVYEIPVGPVHAGIIEPGHFRFLAVGEQILNLEERLGYVHKGIEKRMEGRRAPDAARLAARISGDATVAHGWAFASAVELAAQAAVSPRAQALRAVLCERERMANHIGDIGTICNDAAWGFMHGQCQRLREEMARMHGRLFGHRLLMDRVVPGGVSCDLDAEGVAALLSHTHSVAREIRQLYVMYEDHAPIRERVVGSGKLSPADAAELGLLGYAGRGAGVDVDVRRDAAYAPYDRHRPQVVVSSEGDVAGRLQVRFDEIAESARLIESLLTALPGGPVLTDLPPVAAGATAFTAIESWRGEIAAWLRFGEDGRIDRYYVRDPSMINWLGLELAAREVPVPDFPLNNKSFNCSYAGHDL